MALRVSTLLVDFLATGSRVDAFLATQFPDLSRSYFQRLVELQAIRLNDKLVLKSSQKVKKDDVLVVAFPLPKTSELKPMNIPLTVVDEQPDFLVLNKEPGILVHPPAEDLDEPSLVHALLYRYQQLPSTDAYERPGIVHRLDRDTSGIILIARTLEGQIGLSALFKDRLMHKEYLAIVKGEPPKKGTINKPIGRHQIHRHKMGIGGLDAREALSHFEVIEYFNGAALVKVHIVTGRTHQIRVHMASLGHPVLGDSLYGVAHKGIARQALHAAFCRFTYREKNYSYASSLPEDMQNLLELLRSSTEKEDHHS